jgi:hypothetical protein
MSLKPIVLNPPPKTWENYYRYLDALPDGEFLKIGMDDIPRHLIVSSETLRPLSSRKLRILQSRGSEPEKPIRITIHYPGAKVDPQIA